jgi:hypothetical protein
MVGCVWLVQNPEASRAYCLMLTSISEAIE